MNCGGTWHLCMKSLWAHEAWKQSCDSLELASSCTVKSWDLMRFAVFAPGPMMHMCRHHNLVRTGRLTVVFPTSSVLMCNQHSMWLRMANAFLCDLDWTASWDSWRSGVTVDVRTGTASLRRWGPWAKVQPADWRTSRELGEEVCFTVGFRWFPSFKSSDKRKLQEFLFQMHKDRKVGQGWSLAII